MGLLGIWNVSFLHHSTRAILPYAQALAKLAPHIQQVRRRAPEQPEPLLLRSLGTFFVPLGFYDVKVLSPQPLTLSRPDHEPVAQSLTLAEVSHVLVDVSTERITVSAVGGDYHMRC